MPEKAISDVIGKYSENDFTVKLCRTIFSVVPNFPPFQFYNTLDGAATRLNVTDEAAKTKAGELANQPEIKSAVWVADAVDKADMGISVVTGVKNILSLFGGTRQQSTFEADPQQAVDAVMKAAALSYIIYKTMPGDIGQKISRFFELPAGKELTLYYAMAEIALPFTDDLVSGGASLISRLFSRHRGDMNQKFSSVVGGDGMKQAGEVLEKMEKPLGEYIDMAKGHTGTVMNKIREFLPSASTIGNIADSATGAAATAMDVMPVWSFLGSRAAAEACAYRALQNL